MKKKKRITKRGITLTILFLLIVFCVGLLVYYFVSFTKNDEPKNTAKIVSEIKGFEYTLDDRDTKLMKNEFEILRKNLESDEIDYDEYAKSLAKLFVIDLYTLNNKINKYDVGSLEYLDSNIIDNFNLKATDTLYKYVEDDSNDTRNQDLPEVSGIKVVIEDENTYDISKFEDDVIVIYIEWEYDNDLEYDNNAYIVMKRVDKKLVIIEFNTEENQD